MGANFALGVRIGDFNEEARSLIEINRQLQIARQAAATDPELIARLESRLADESRAFDPMHNRKRTHVWVGISAALMVLLVNAICITYFVGTGRWCKEVVETYDLDRQFILEGNQLKRRTFPWALSGMLALIALVTLGAASDPAANFKTSQQWVIVHFTCALLGILWIGCAFSVQLRRLDENYALIQRVVEQVQAIRRARGLDTSDRDDQPEPTDQTDSSSQSETTDLR